MTDHCYETPPPLPAFQRLKNWDPQDKAMNALSDQLIDLQMEDAVPMELLVVDEGADGEDGPNAPSPSESDAAKAAAAAASKGSSRSELKAQKHQVGPSFAARRAF